MKVRTERLAAVTLLSDGSVGMGGSTEEDEEVAWVEAVVVIAAARAAVRGDVGVGGGVGAGVVTGGVELQQGYHQNVGRRCEGIEWKLWMC